MEFDSLSTKKQSWRTRPPLPFSNNLLKLYIGYTVYNAVTTVLYEERACDN